MGTAAPKDSMKHARPDASPEPRGRSSDYLVLSQRCRKLSDICFCLLQPFCKQLQKLDDWLHFKYDRTLMWSGHCRSYLAYMFAHRATNEPCNVPYDAPIKQADSAHRNLLSHSILNELSPLGSET